MGVWRIVLAFAVVAALLALAFVQVEVPALDPHQGAVAYTHPVLNSTYGETFEYPWDTDVSGEIQPTKAAPSVEARVIKYTGPAPVRKPLWQAIVKPGCIGVSCEPGFTAPPTASCTTTALRTDSFDVTTYVNLTILEPGGQTTTYTSPPVKWTISQNVFKVSCTDGSQSKIKIVQLGNGVTYEAGAYYFTKGYGDYVFKLSVHLVTETGPQTLGQVSLDVPVTPDNLGSP